MDDFDDATRAFFANMPPVVNRNMARIMGARNASGRGYPALERPVDFTGDESPWEFAEKIAEMLGVPVAELVREDEG